MKEFYIVVVDRPRDRLSVEDVREYLQDAVGAWKGGYDPKDERCLIDLVRVEKLTGSTAKRLAVQVAAASKGVDYGNDGSER